MAGRGDGREAGAWGGRMMRLWSCEQWLWSAEEQRSHSERGSRCSPCPQALCRVIYTH